MVLTFSKYHSTGNDFIMIDNRNLSIKLTPEQVHFLCQRKLGIGADGLILIQNHKDADFEMIYYNADGNLGSFCGNGSRAAVLYAKEIGVFVKSNVLFKAYDGFHQAEILNQEVKVLMNPYKNLQKFNEKEFFLDTGSPHHVVFVKDIFHYPVEQEGKAIRYHERYQPNGTNVNFVEVLENGIFVRTYERGVETETLSCGTGVTAAAICYLKTTHQSQGMVNVLTFGGNLKVNVNSEKEIFLQGPSVKVFHGYISL